MADETKAIALGDIDRIRDNVNNVYDVYKYDRCATLMEHQETEAELTEVMAAFDRLEYLEQLVASPPPTEPRAIIRHFAAAMERKLAANDGVKDGWRIATKQANMMRWKALRHLTALRNEVGELEQAVIDMDSLRKEANAEQVQDILMEAADCALFAMFIADVCGALPPTDERGR